jgi:hypothetical protein
MKPSNLLEEARNINSSLSRVQQTLSWTVQQTQNTATTLQDDGTLVENALHDHKYELRNALKTTKRRLDKIQSTEQYERIATIASTSFFTIVVCYIILNRLRFFSLIWQLVACRTQGTASSTGAEL